ncbi:MAG: cysteine--tRNA ligase, partial [Planctomycetota bacterium]
MNVRLYDSLTREVRDFVPATEGEVLLYACGPTVYAPAHIGNFRANVCWDVLRRSLEILGFKVHKIMNLTDVGHLTQDDVADGGDDKMEEAAKREGVEPLEIA